MCLARNLKNIGKAKTQWIEKEKKKDEKEGFTDRI